MGLQQSRDADGNTASSTPPLQPYPWRGPLDRTRDPCPGSKRIEAPRPSESRFCAALGAIFLESVAEKNAGALSRASDGPPRAAAQLDDASGARAVVLEERPSADGADRVCKLSMWLQKSRLASRGRGY